MSTSGGLVTANALTPPLTITNTVIGTVPLSIVGANGQTADLLDITAFGGAAGGLMSVDLFGGLHTGSGQFQLSLTLGGQRILNTQSTFACDVSGNTGVVRLRGNAGAFDLLTATGVAAAVNYVAITAAVTTVAPTIASAGEANAPLIVRANGTGGVTLAAAGNLLGMYGVAPVARAGAITPPAATASTNVTPFGFTTAAQADALVTAVRAIQLALANVGITS